MEREPIHFGRTRRHRFDSPLGDFGTLYLGGDSHCAFIETFGHRTGEVDWVTVSALEARGLARIRPGRRLRLVDLSGSGLALLGADARLCSGSISISQRWAQALFEHPERPDGVYYRSRHDPERFCAAVFDRVSDVMVADPLGSLAEPINESLLADILDAYGFGLIDDQRERI